MSAANKVARAGETLSPSPRTHRLFSTDGAWYFKTRERPPVGPYFCRQEALKTIKRFTQLSRNLPPEFAGKLADFQRDKVQAKLDCGDFPHRPGDTRPAPARSERVFVWDGHWFFRTREGINVGPCRSRELAGEAAERFVAYAGKLPGTKIPDLIRGCQNAIALGRAGEAIGCRRKTDAEGSTQPIERSERVVCFAGLWFVNTREGWSLGPFRSKQEAQGTAGRFASLAQDIAPERLAGLVSVVMDS